MAFGVKLTDAEKQKIFAEYHVGVTQSELARRYKLSKATINKLCKGVPPRNVDTVKTLVRIEEDLRSQDPLAVREVRYEVDKRLRDMEFFRMSSITVVNKVMEKVENEPGISMFDLEKAQNVIGKGKETIYGKSPETAVQINNGVSNASTTDLSHLTLAEKIEIKRKLFRN